MEKAYAELKAVTDHGDKQHAVEYTSNIILHILNGTQIWFNIYLIVRIEITNMFRVSDEVLEQLVFKNYGMSFLSK